VAWPRVVLADRMACLKGAVVADVVVPTPAYVRFATLYGFRPDFCQGGDPESKGMVEHLVGYAKRDLVVPQAPFSGLMAANDAAALWCAERNAVAHSEICAVPDERLEAERALLGPLPSLRPSMGKVVTRKVDRLSCVRFGSARYSVPVALIGKLVEVHVAEGAVRIVHLGVTMATHELVAPGETSVLDEHYGSPRLLPRRAPRPRTPAEHALIALGPVSEAFLKGAAAAGVTKLASELQAIAALERAHGRRALVAALERAVAFGRWRAGDVRSILEAGTGVARPTAPGEALIVEFALAALAEIGGAWLVWQGVREHRGLLWVGGGVAALGFYGLVATWQPFDDFGRILAAYGGVFVAGSLTWGVIVDRFRPDRYDIAGAVVCLLGVAIIMYAPR
jgi:drug/metabolite transporter superfamily protein YnfA